MAEELALAQVIGDGAEVDGHEAPLPPPAPGVDRLGDQLLTRPGFALDEDGRVAALDAGTGETRFIAGLRISMPS